MNRVFLSVSSRLSALQWSTKSLIWSNIPTTRSRGRHFNYSWRRGCCQAASEHAEKKTCGRPSGTLAPPVGWNWTWIEIILNLSTCLFFCFNHWRSKWLNPGTDKKVTSHHDNWHFRQSTNKRCAWQLCIFSPRHLYFLVDFFHQMNHFKRQTQQIKGNMTFIIIFTIGGKLIQQQSKRSLCFSVH